MRRELFYTLGIVVVVSLAVTARPANAQTTATGPYYATPSWDMKLQCDTQATCPRFIVLSNWDGAAVLDRETGLVWERSPGTNSVVGLSNAQVGCLTSWVGNRKGWRLPTIQELASLVDPSEGDSTVRGVGSGFTFPVGHPFTGLQPLSYWSATTQDFREDHAYVVNFRSGGIGSVFKDASQHVLCVRGGPGLDVQ